MTRTPTYTQPLVDCRNTSLVGGKAANLGRLIRAGFPVPDGFVVTTQAFRYALAQSPDGKTADTLPSAVAEEVCKAYRAMGGGRVAVRSSATAEDGSGASMADNTRQFWTSMATSGCSTRYDNAGRASRPRGPWPIFKNMKLTPSA